MACGCPVVVSDIPGNREWVHPAINGWLFRDGDPGALAQAILQAIEQREKLAEMGQAARQIAVERADWQSNFPALLRAYELAVSS
jgi:glycosyltransferase involved in cell wall biosynthesis